MREQLGRLAEQINQQTDRLTAGVRTTVKAAREIGLRLTEVKRLLNGTGTRFKAWVGENCRFSYISACRYVRLAEHWDRFTDQQRVTSSIPELLDQVASHRRVRADRNQVAPPKGTGGERGELFFSYYGGKLLRSGRYPAPAHRLIIKPFAGSTGYSTRYRDREVRLYDVNPKVVGTWEYLIRSKASQMRVLPTEVEHLDDHPGLIQEAQWLIGWWLNKGCATPRKRWSAWMPQHRSDGCYWSERVRDRLAVQVESVRHWRVYQKSYHEIPDELATWFVDPPYQGKVGSHHAHKFTDPERLADWCCARTGQVSVCEHKGANWLPFQPLGPTGATVRRRVVGLLQERDRPGRVPAEGVPPGRPRRHRRRDQPRLSRTALPVLGRNPRAGGVVSDGTRLGVDHRGRGLPAAASVRGDGRFAAGVHGRAREP